MDFFFFLCPLSVVAHSKVVCVVSEDSARLEGQTGIKLWDWQATLTSTAIITHTHTHKHADESSAWTFTDDSVKLSGMFNCCFLHSCEYWPQWNIFKWAGPEIIHFLYYFILLQISWVWLKNFIFFFIVYTIRPLILRADNPFNCLQLSFWIRLIVDILNNMTQPNVSQAPSPGAEPVSLRLQGEWPGVQQQKFLQGPSISVLSLSFCVWYIYQGHCPLPKGFLGLCPRDIGDQSFVRF